MKNNVDRFDKAIFDNLYWDYEELKPLLECLNKGTRVHTVEDYERAAEEFPDLKIIRK